MARSRRKNENDSLAQDIIGILAVALGAVLLIGLLAPGSGQFGKILGRFLMLMAGLGAYITPVLLIVGGIILLADSRLQIAANRVSGFVIIFLVFNTWCQFMRMPELVGMGYPPHEFLIEGGGWLGYGMGIALEAVFGRVASYFVLTALAIVSLIIITGMRFTQIIGLVTGSLGSLLRSGQGIRRPAVREPVKPVETKSSERPTVLSIIKRRLQVEDGETVPDPAPVRIKKVEPVLPSSVGTIRQHSDSEFSLPPITLLKEPSTQPKRAQAELNYKIDRIEQTLEEFKIEADVVEVSHGPTVTRYEIQLAPGIKVSKIVSLADNLAMSLAAIDVRVEAPIPGKSAIGVEVPNDNPAVVTLREVIDNGQFWNAHSKLTFALGKDVAAEPRFADLTKMPHMLIAGATNSGKSICLNALIASLLFRATPRELKFILIDPKRVELSLYDGIPHLCAPVVRDVRHATGILRAAIKEMEHRYDLFVKTVVRDFASYNQKVKPEERLPYIVIIIDELSDLMMQAGPEVEFGIHRLAQLARATGIHLIVATQRPSVDVVTGTIKANISSRISFAVNSQIDSRTILDMGGADRLIGRGDMLFKPIDVSKPTRIQGCMISEKEIEALVKYLKEQESPNYTMEPVTIGEAGGGGGSDDAFTDEMYEPAVRLVVTSGYASTSMLQRRFKIGYTRAARLVDAMEDQGIVGPLDGAKPRQVLVMKDDLDRILGVQGVAVAEEEYEEIVEE